MTAIDPLEQDQYSAWNPGIAADIPASWRELETIYDPANTLTTLDDVIALATETGLSREELVCFRPERLVLHELIVRVTADIVVLEGDTEEDLGINFRRIVERLLEHWIAPEMEAIVEAYALLYAALEARIRDELDTLLAPPSGNSKQPKTGWRRWFGSKSPARPSPVLTRQERDLELINGLRRRGLEASDRLDSAALRSLYRVLGSIATSRGQIGNDINYLAQLGTRHAINYLGSREIGERIGSLIDTTLAAEGLSLIPDAEKPVLFSLKGASAAGKSSLRPMLRAMMQRLGIDQQGYGTISPDIWRRLLLDYEALGEAYKYAGRFSSHEVNIIDGKLDRYIRAKAEARHSIPHLVVDRFRFDSFASEKVSRVLHKTYVRYIDSMYMYFVVTPPAETVLRGWERGLVRGRYKAVEDFLGHCVEAYAGMPRLLFKWLGNDSPIFHFEFLDNSVPKGSYPTLIARGTQGSMQIFHPAPLIDIERYQRINIHATGPQAVMPPGAPRATAENLGFLRQCISRIASIDFINDDTGKCYLAIRAGVFEITDAELFKLKIGDPTLRDIVASLAPHLLAEDELG